MLIQARGSSIRNEPHGQTEADFQLKGGE